MWPQLRNSSARLHTLYATHSAHMDTPPQGYWRCGLLSARGFAGTLPLMKHFLPANA